MTKIDISNRALAVIGHDRTISSFEESSAEAIRCNQFYPAAKNNVLAAYNWEFASVDDEIEMISDITEWNLPDNFLKVVSILDNHHKTIRSVRAGEKLLLYKGDGDIAIVRYLRQDVDEENLPHLVVEAIVYELASLLLGPMAGNVQKQDGTALFESYLKLAAQKLSAAITGEDAEHAYMGGNRTDEAASKTDIVNRALAKLGGDTVITDLATDNTPVAARARLLFRSSLLAVLKRRDWDFAANEIAVALSWDDEAGFSRMRLPSDCVKICKCFDERHNPLECRRNRDFFYVKSGGSKANIRYISSDVDFSTAPDAFIDLVAMDLAVKLAPTVVRDAKAVTALISQLEMKINEQAFEEANETANPGEWKNPLISCRY